MDIPLESRRFSSAAPFGFVVLSLVGLSGWDACGGGGGAGMSLIASGEAVGLGEGGRAGILC